MSVLCGLVFLGAAAAPREALGEEPGTVEAASLEAPPDVVLLRDGGMLRGAIVEKRVAEFVVIQTALGIRRVVWTDVAWAGPKAEMPTRRKPKAEPTPEARREEPELARLALTASEPVEIYVKSGMAEITGSAGWGGLGAQMASYKPLCMAPCRTELAAGTYRMALSKQGGAPIEALEPLTIEAGRNEVHGTYASYAGTRTAGLLVMIGSVVAGGLLMATSVGEQCDAQGRCAPGASAAQFGIGAGVMAVGGLSGLWMTWMKDESSFDVAR